MNTVTMNLENWTGEVATIAYTDAMRFKMYGYTFKVDVTRTFEDGGCVAALNSPDWEDSLTELYFIDNETPEQMVRKAVIYVANRV